MDLPETEKQWPPPIKMKFTPVNINKDISYDLLDEGARLIRVSAYLNVSLEALESRKLRQIQFELLRNLADEKGDIMAVL